MLTGEPGVGKSAVMDAAVAGLSDVTLLRAAGSESEREVPFGGLSRLLRPVLSDLDAIPPPQAQALGAALALRAGPAPDRFAVGAATLSLLCRHAEQRPVLALVDDLQWWDRPSIQALAFAAHRLTLDPVAVLGAARAVQARSELADLPALELSGLPVEAASVLLAETTGGGWLDAELLARLHRATAGNPLALVELGQDPATLLAAYPETPFPVPTTVSTAFTARARALSTGARQVLEVLAVTDGDLLSAATACRSLGLALTDLAEAESAGLVTVRADQAHFRHPLVRSAVYADADPSWRRAVHRAVADTLLDDDRRAWHLAEASLGPDPAVADLLTAAGRRAARRSAHSVAAAAYERAARLSRSPAEARSRWLAAAEAASSAGNARHVDRLLGLAGLLSGPGEQASDRPPTPTCGCAPSASRAGSPSAVARRAWRAGASSRRPR